MAEYKISLGVQLQTDDIASQINEAERKVDPIKIKVDAETKELTQSIQDALKTLSKGGQNTLTLDTSKFEGSIADIKSAVIDLKKVLGSLDDSANMKSLLSSVNQIANAIGKVTDESETLAKSLSALSKKDLSFNLGIDMGKTNNNMIAYGRAARKQVIPQLESQIKELESIFGGQQATMNKLTAKGSKVGFDVFTDFADFNSDSAIKKMEAMEKYINSLKKLANIENIPLGQFEEKFSKSATELINDITGVENAVEKAEDTTQKLKNIFGGGVGAEQLSAELEPIVSDLNQIREAIQNLSKGVSLDGLTASFDRLSSAIENLLANANKVKGVLNSGFDVGNVGADINSIKTPTTTRKRAQSDANSLIDGYLNELGIQNKDKTTVKSKLDAFAKVSSRGVGDELYDAALSDLMGTIKQLGVVSKQADVNMEALFAELKSSKIDAPKDIYKSEFGDDWKHIKSTYKMLGSGTGLPVDSRYQELSEKYPSYFPEDIWNPADQLKQILNVYDTASEMSKNRKVGVYDEFGYEGIKDRVLSIVEVMQEQSEIEQRVAQASTQTANTVSQNQDKIRQEYEQTQQEIARLDKAIDETAELVRNPDALGDNISMDDKMQILEGYQRSIEKMEQDKATLESKASSLKAQLEAEEQQAHQTAEAVDQLANAHQNAAKINTTSGVDDDFKAIGVQVKATEDQIENLQTALHDFGFSGSAIKSVTDDIEKVGFEVKEITHQLNNDGSVKITVKGVDDLNQAVTAIKSVRMVDDEPDISTTTKITQKLDHTAESFKKLKSLAKEMGDIDIKIAGLEAEGKVDEANSLRRVLDGLKSDYQELYMVTEKNLNVDQIKELDQIFANTTGEVREFKTELEEAAKTQELTSGLEKLKSITQEINGLKIELFKSEDDGNIERVANQLNNLEEKASELRAELQQKFPTASFDEIDDIARKGDEAITQLMHKVAEAKAKLAQGIKVDMELGNFDNEISGMYEKFNKLSGASVELRNAVEQVENAYREMELAIQGTGDEVADRERLIKAEREYAAALEKTNNLIRIQAREDKVANDRFKLDDDIKLFQADIDRWLATNSAATKQFGSRMLDLKTKAEGVDRVTLNGLIRQFKLADKEAEKFGLKGLSVVDKLKTKFKEYSTYLSAAEVFMWAEQGLRDMFEQVKLIDTAMTELKKVTDETDASYNKFLSNAASRSKELGTTIDGLVSSTADFARLGYSFEESQGLAEVANVYAVVGDEIDGVEGATESLVSTLAAFKDELSGISDTDFAMDIIDKFNEVSNNFSISSGGIGEAMQRSASSLRAANNTIDESIALITAANSVVQDPTVVGTAFKTKFLNCLYVQKCA